MRTRIRIVQCLGLLFVLAAAAPAPAGKAGRPASTNAPAPATVAPASLCPPDAVRLDYRDTDGDGMPEMVLENRFLQVEIMTGKRPEPAPLSRFARWFAGKKNPPKYATRFVWAGWINNIVFKPSGQRWFADDHRHHWQGIPEEFEQAIKMHETAPGRFDVLKIGIGVCTGRGICHSGSLKLVRAAPWQRMVLTTPEGGKEIVFKQSVTTRYGYGYEYEKHIRLDPSASRLLVRRILRNTGKHPLHTTWYAHAFWAQAAKGPGYDADSWTTIPLRLGPPNSGAPARGLVDDARCLMDWPVRYPVWGAIEGDRLAEPWTACGNRSTRDVFGTRFDRPRAWERIWTYTNTYACEPFFLIDLAPGAAMTWTFHRLVGRGLDRVRAVGPGAILDWRFLPRKTTAGAYDLAVQLLVMRPALRLTLAGSLEPRADGPGSTRKFSAPVSGVGPALPAAHRFKLGVRPGTYTLRLRLLDGAGTPLAAVRRLVRIGTPAPAPNLPVHAWPAAATILTPLSGQGRAAVPDTAAAYVESSLRFAGFQVRFADPRKREGPDPYWNVSRVVVLVDLPRLPRWLPGWLEKFAAQGNGLIFFSPLDLRAFEFSPLLPVQRVLGEANLFQPSPRDGTREFLQATEATRYQLKPATSHPILEGIPFYPNLAQDIARLQVLAPKPGASVLLRYVHGADVPIPVRAPALVAGTYRKGRIAVFASPPDWGLPHYWVLFGRVREYQRKLFAQMALWSAGLLNPKSE